MKREDANINAGGQSLAWIFYVTMLSLACLTGCASSSSGITPGDIPSNTQLALSPNGKRLLVSWNDSNEKLHAKLLELNANEVASVREITLPSNTYATAFTRNNEQLLLTTLSNGASHLLTFRLNDSQINLIYKSERMMRFPLEVDEGNYVFLEGTDPSNKRNKWQRFQQGQKTLLNPVLYHAATRLGIVNGTLFILEPSSPPAFRSLYGELPNGLVTLVDNTTLDIVCADKSPLSCVRTHQLYRKEVYEIKGERKEIDGQSYQTMEIFNGVHRCEVAGQWVDLSEVQISRDGSVVVFLAAIEKWNDPHSVYVVKNNEKNCLVSRISTKGN